MIPTKRGIFSVSRSHFPRRSCVTSRSQQPVEFVPTWWLAPRLTPSSDTINSECYINCSSMRSDTLSLDEVLHCRATEKKYPVVGPRSLKIPSLASQHKTTRLELFPASTLGISSLSWWNHGCTLDAGTRGVLAEEASVRDGRPHTFVRFSLSLFSFVSCAVITS